MCALVSYEKLEISEAINRLHDHLSFGASGEEVCAYGARMVWSERSRFFGVRNCSASCADVIVRESVEQFQVLQRETGKHLCSLTVLLPESFGFEKAEARLAEVREGLVRSGAMIGLLGPECELNSVKDGNKSSSFPFKTDDKWLNIRSAIDDDWRFCYLNSNLDAALRYYLENSHSACD